MEPKVELYLNHEIGLWLIRKVLYDPNLIKKVRLVVSPDLSILKEASPVFDVYQNHLEIDTPAKDGILLSVHYDRKFSQEYLSHYKTALNLHPSYLPYGRGRHPIFWAVYNGEPLGATLHYIVEEIDKGPIVKQIRVEDTSLDGYGAYLKVLECQKEIMTYDLLREIFIGQRMCAMTPDYTVGSNHKETDIYEIKKTDKSEHAKRCLSFKGYTLNGKLCQ